MGHVNNRRFRQKRSGSILGRFYRDSLRVKIFQIPMASLFAGICFSALMGGLSKSSESLVMDFSFLHHKKNKVRAAKDDGETSEVC